MPPPLHEVVHHLRRAVLRHEEIELSDGQLLGRFIEHRDEAAVTALVRRHGPMVWGVCRRILSHLHDAEDAFQATFLVLVRKAGSIRQRERIGSWLHAVAHQTALKARAMRAKRRTRETQVVVLPEVQAPEPDAGRDWQPVLDQELSQLPEKYQIAIILCDLEGRTRKEAARQLGLPEGTLAGRLTRGRALLAKRLARHGLAVTGGVLGTALAQPGISATVPPLVLSVTIKSVTAAAASSTAATGLTSGTVAALTEGVMKAMLLTRLKSMLGACLVLGLLAFASMHGYRSAAARATAAPAEQKDRLADTLILLDKQLWEAASRHDVDTISKILADDWTSNPNEVRWTKAFSLEHYRKSRYTEVKILTPRAVVRIDEHTAIMTYDVKWRGETKGGGTSSGHDRCIHCWVQRDGGWFIKYTECVHLPALPPPAFAPPDGRWRVYPLIGPARLISPEQIKLDPGISPEQIKLDPGNNPYRLITPEQLKQLYPEINPYQLTPEQLKPLNPSSAPKNQLRVRASSSWQNDCLPARAFDGRRDTFWNSGTYAPAWIEADLGAPRPLAGVVLSPVQDIIGPTTHEVWISNQPIGNDRTNACLAHTFKGEPRNAQPLAFDFPKDRSARYVQIRTTQSPTWIAWWEVEIRVRERGKIGTLTLDTAAAPAPRDDRKALQGAWELVSVEMGGKDVTRPRQKKEQWIVKDGWITVQSKDEQVPYYAVFQVWPDRNPREIDINPYPVGVFIASDIVKGIYTLEGDTWKVCLRSLLLGDRPRDWAERPKEMVAKKGRSEVLITLKRIKPKPPPEKKPVNNRLGPSLDAHPSRR